MGNDNYDGLDNWTKNPPGGGSPGPDHGNGPHPHGGGGGDGSSGSNDDSKKKKPKASTEKDVVHDGQSGQGSGGSSASGGSSGSSGGYSAPSRFDRLASEGEGLYYQLWGEFPPPGYVKSLVRRGMNIFEIEDFERSKPAFKRTETYQNEWAGYAKMLSQIMGTR